MNNCPRAAGRVRGRTAEPRPERGADGSTITTRATLYGDQSIVATTGNWGNDYSATFEPTDDGRNLQLTRHTYDADLAQPVTVESFYRKSSDEARWDVYTWMPGDPYADSDPGHASVPNGTRLVATLNDALTTQHTREGDRFTLTIRSPSQYQDAVIGGFVNRVNGASMFRSVRSATRRTRISSVRLGSSTVTPKLS